MAHWQLVFTLETLQYIMLPDFIVVNIIILLIVLIINFNITFINEKIISVIEEPK